MQTITINLYEYSELSLKAKEKALNKWNETNDDPFMQSHMINLLKEELDERGIKYDTDSINVYYSLTYSQGDGFMFEGQLVFEGEDVSIVHSGHYYHSYCKQVDWPGIDLSGGKEQEEEERFKRFEGVYQDICKKMERAGYEYIEWYTSEEAFIETCEANGYMFRENGEMENAQ